MITGSFKISALNNNDNRIPLRQVCKNMEITTTWKFIFNVQSESN